MKFAGRDVEVSGIGEGAERRKEETIIRGGPRLDKDEMLQTLGSLSMIKG